MSQERKRIPSIGPSVSQLEIDYVTDAVTNGWYDGMNSHMGPFLEEFSSHIGMKYVLPVSHGTAAIHLSMIALGIGPGDEVIVPDITWVASASPIVYEGGTPVFVDIDPLTWCICAKSFEAAITPNTKAVMVVSLYGNMPDMNEIKRIAKANNVVVIEDAAEGVGALYDGKPCGSLGDINVFSFNATKMMMSGQGGMFATNNEEWFDKAKLFAHHGIDKKEGDKFYWSTVVGYNYNWSNLQAALALAQFRRLEELVQIRRNIFSMYQERLGGVEGIQINYEAENVRNTYWITSAFLDPSYGMTKEEFNIKFNKFNIDVRPFFYPITSMPPYQKYKDAELEARNSVSYNLSPYGICLPSGSTLTEQDVDYVCESFLAILQSK